MIRNTKSFKILLFAVLSGLSLWQCNETSQGIPDLKYSYFPLEMGHWVEYRLDSIKYDNNALPIITVDSISVFIREEIAESYTDNEGRETFTINRFKKKTASAQYLIDRAWSANLTALNAQKTEDDLRFIKLIFPPELNKSWNGNIFINTDEAHLEYLDNWNYEITSLDEPVTFGSLSFDSTITVIQNSDSSLVHKTFAKEQYARNVGLVYKELHVLKKQNVNVGWDQPEQGVIIRQRVIGYKQ